MDKADCFNLGHIAKLHGYKGEVSLFLDVTNPSDYHKLSSLFIELNDQLTPFFVTSIRPKNNGFATIKLEGVNDEESAKKILRKEVYLPDVILPDLEGTQFYDHEVVGFDVLDSEAGKIGKVVTIVDLKSNPLLQVDKNGVEILIPLVTNLVTKVDRKNRILEITAPPGLIDIYLG